MFRPKSLLIRHAAKLVADRLSLKPGAPNPIFDAVREDALPLLVKSGDETATRNGAWYFSTDVWWPHNLSYSEPSEGQVSCDGIFVETAALDNLWPDPSLGAALPQTIPEGLYLSPFMVLMIEAIRKFEITGEVDPTLKKDVLEQHFIAQKLPKGTAISENQAKMMATFVRSPEAMRGGQKRAG